MGIFSRAKPLGEVPIPGEMTLELPAGKVELRYVEAREGRNPKPGSGRPFGGQPSLPISFRPLDNDGDAIEPVPPRGVQRGAGGGTIWSKHGSVELPAAGEYVVSAGEIEETASVPPERIDPRIALVG